MCFPANVSQEDLDRILEQYGAKNPVSAAIEELGGDRFTVDDTIWTGEGVIGIDGFAIPAHLTYSFPSDGVTWGLAVVVATAPNTLNASFEAEFGVGNIDKGREYFRQGIAAWERISGLTYDEVADDDAPHDMLESRVATRGDIRVGGASMPAQSFVAYNAFPSAILLGVGGGDMLINTAFFVDDPDPDKRILSDSREDYLVLRNVFSHEHGHGVGFLHQTPCDQTKLMEPFLSSAFDMLQIDELRAGNANYGDRNSPNYTAVTAHDFGTLDAPVVRSVWERDVSTNGVQMVNGTAEDWYRFTLTQAQSNIVIVVEPKGGAYITGLQIFDCLGLDGIINATGAGNLALELRSADGLTLIDSANSGGVGSIEFLIISNLAAGEYTIRVVDVGPNPNPAQDVQLYNLNIQLGSAPARPTAIAGLNKRIAASTNCFFMGHINSFSNESFGTPLDPTDFDWDLDGDGTFEVLGIPQPIFQYTANGVYPVTLRVTDDTTLSSIDTISVTVFGATTVLLDIVPGQVDPDSSTPIVITGANLKNVANANAFTVSGGGVSISGTPQPNALGTQVDGLSLSANPGAATGLRDLSVSNADGSATLVGAIIIGPVGCAGDANASGVIDFGDINAVLGNWLADYSPGTGAGDANRDGIVDFEDINSVLGNWLAVCP